MGLKGRDGVDIKDAWADGIKTYLGLTIPNFPNAFIIYGPQGRRILRGPVPQGCLPQRIDAYGITAPSTLSNGPTLIEAQADLVMEMIQKAEAETVKSVVPTQAAVREWGDVIESATKKTLLAFTKSWWTNSNVVGKKTEFLTFIGGIKQYEDLCRERIVDWKGFDVVPYPAEMIMDGEVVHDPLKHATSTLVPIETSTIGR